MKDYFGEALRAYQSALDATISLQSEAAGQINNRTSQ